MTLSEIGIFWLWALLAAGLGLPFASPQVRDALRRLGVASWELCRPLWDAAAYKKEAEPVDQAFKGLLARLLRSGFFGAAASVGPKFSKRRIEFKKYFRLGGNGIRLRFPIDEWASPYFQKMRPYFEARDLPYRIDGKKFLHAVEFFCVDFGRDLESAAFVTRGIWTEVFGLPEDAPRRFRHHGISPFGEPVDRADQRMMKSWKERRRHRLADRDVPSFGRGCLIAVWVLFFRGVVIFGLYVTALSSDGAAAEWSLAIAGMSLGGSLESLVFLYLYLSYVTVGRFAERQFLPQTQDEPPLPRWLEKAHRAFRWIVRITLPVAVVLVWTGA